MKYSHSYYTKSYYYMSYYFKVYGLLLEYSLSNSSFVDFLNLCSQCYSWDGAMSHRPIQHKNSPLTTEIAILNLERMAHWNFKFIGNKWKMAHTTVCPAITLRSDKELFIFWSFDLDRVFHFVRFIFDWSVVMCKSGIIMVNFLIFSESSYKKFRQIFVFVFIQTNWRDIFVNISKF